MQTIVEIVGLAMKIDIVPIDGILISMLTESKTEVLTEVSKTVEAKIVESKIVVLKIVLTTEEHKIVKHTVSIVDDVDLRVEEEGGCSLLDDVVDTSKNDVLSCEGAESDWTFDVSTMVTIKLAKVFSKLNVASNFLGE